jgi:hypothetical protein
VGTALEVGRLSIEADGREARGVDIGGRLAAGPALIGIATGRVATAGGAVGATGTGDAAGTGPDEPPLAGAVPAVGVPPGGLAADGPALGLSPARGVAPVLVSPEEPEPPLGGSFVVLPGVSVVVPGGLVEPLVAPVLVALGLSLPLLVAPPALSVAPLPVLDPDVLWLVVVVLVLLVVVFVELVTLVVLLELSVDFVVLVPASSVASAPAGASAGAVAVASAVPVPVATVVASAVVVLSAVVVVVSVVVSVAAAVAALNPQHAIAKAATSRHRLVNPALRAAAVPALGKKVTSGLAKGTDSDDRPSVVDRRWHDNRSSRQLTLHSPVHIYRLTR